MKRRPRTARRPAIKSRQQMPRGNIGLVFSGGGSRAAYQVGILKALIDEVEFEDNPVRVIVGSSIGAVNALVFAACLKEGPRYAAEVLESMWAKRTFRNSFQGSPSRTFLRSVKIVLLKYAKNPGPFASEEAIFDPTPLISEVDAVLDKNGGLSVEVRESHLDAVGIMTTIEGPERKPLLFVSSKKQLSSQALAGASYAIAYVDTLSAKHGFASAALPTVLPPVQLDIEHGTVSLVDGGISQNIPVDPAVRLGAEKVIVMDVSGRDWWLKRYDESPDTRPSWEVPAELETFCLRPPETFVARCRKPLGPVLKAAVGSSTRSFIRALGPTWPVFTLSKNRLGEDIAYEIMSYIALDPDYTKALIEMGYNETLATLRTRSMPAFTDIKDYKKWYSQG